MLARTLFPFLLGLCLCSSARVARAERERDPAAAETLFRRGIEALRAGNWPEACQKFQSSMELDPAVATALKIARCHRHDGRLADAWYAYQQALKLNRLLVQAEARREELEQVARVELAELEPLVPRIQISVERAVPGMELRRNGALLPNGAIGEELFVDPGKHEILLEAPGYVAQKRTIVVSEGDKRAVSLVLKPRETTNVPAAPAVNSSEVDDTTQTAPRYEPRYWNGQRVAGAVLSGAGVTSLGMASVFGVITLSKVADAEHECRGGICSSEGAALREDARDAQTKGLILLGVGVGVLLAGGIVFFTAEEKAEKKADRRELRTRFEPERLRFVW